MFIYTKFKIVKAGENPRWLFRDFVGRVLDGRISCGGNHQIKHPRFSDWFDIPENLIEVQNQTVNMAKTDNELLKLYLKEFPEMMGEFGSIDEMPDEHKRAVTGTMLFGFFRLQQSFLDLAETIKKELNLKPRKSLK